MADFLKQAEYARNHSNAAKLTSPGTSPVITIGTVVDTNDPQQMGRVRVVCPMLNDRFDSPLEDIPWAMYATPFGGSVSVGTRGPEENATQGAVSYGMWAIPKVGAQALIMCIDANPLQRVWVGCLYGQFLPHTMPHGRFFAGNHPALPTETGKPVGPLSTDEDPIQPLYSNLKEAFGESQTNYEWKTRAADYSVAGVDLDVIHTTQSIVPEDKDVKLDDRNITQGYGVSRIAPHLRSSVTEKNYDPTIYSITTPGFHSLSMDDRGENCRVRLRTSAGHQIIMDDTNERIYVSTAKGNNWIEIDQAGNIDVYSEGNISYHAKKAINFTADEIRMYARQGVHIHSEKEIRMKATTDMHISSSNLRVHTVSSAFIEATGNLSMKGATTFIEATATLNLLAGGNILETGAAVHLNGPPASPASPAGEQNAFFTNRIPDHEPYARTMTKNDFTLEPEFSYDDPNVGKSERGTPITRNTNWQR